MSGWKKLLAQMVESERCVGFTYDDAAKILSAMGFRQASHGGSHRRWVLLREGHPAVIIGLVDKGHGDMKPVYIKEMLATLSAQGLLGGVDDAVR